MSRLSHRVHRAPWQLIALGGLVVGTLDLVFAYAFWKPRGVRLSDILQSIAAGWYGEQSQAMGTTSVLVGALSHYGIAIIFVLAYWLVARRVQALLRRTYVYGSLYGLLLYLAMNLVVLPLSAAGSPGFGNLPWVASSVAMHAVLGVLCAFFARQAQATCRASGGT